MSDSAPEWLDGASSGKPSPMARAPFLGSTRPRVSLWPAWISCTRGYEGSGLGLTEADSRVCGWSRGLGRGGSRTRGGEPGRGL